MLNIAKLFGTSPFAPLQTHMGCVACCVGELPALFKALLAQDVDAIERIAEHISTLEHEADLTKHDIRNHLPKSLFLPVDRSVLLEILSLQDAIADQAELIANQAGMRKLSLPTQMKEDFPTYTCKSVEAFWLVRKVIDELENLVEASFGGIEAQKVKGMVEQIAFCEYEMVLIQNKLLKQLYSEGDAMAYPVFHLLLTLIQAIGQIASLSEKLGNRVRMLLELK